MNTPRLYIARKLLPLDTRAALTECAAHHECLAATLEREGNRHLRAALHDPHWRERMADLSALAVFHTRMARALRTLVIRDE